jgi:hypothetical protein
MRPQNAVVVGAKCLALVAAGYNAEMPDHGPADKKEGTGWLS